MLECKCIPACSVKCLPSGIPQGEPISPGWLILQSSVADRLPWTWIPLKAGNIFQRSHLGIEPSKTLPTILGCKNQAELDTKKNSIIILMEYGN